MEDLTDDELEHLSDVQFHEELSAYVAQLTPPSPDMERDYQAKMDYLAAIRNEACPPSPPEEESKDCYDNVLTFDSRYCHTYSLTTRGKTLYGHVTPYHLNFPT